MTLDDLAAIPLQVALEQASVKKVQLFTDDQGEIKSIEVKYAPKDTPKVTGRNMKGEYCP